MNHPDWLRLRPTCPSTNTWALEHLAGLSHGDVVFTSHQTAGRGQWGRHWMAPEGVLTASFILRDLPRPHLSYLSVLVGLAVVQMLEAHAPSLAQRLQIKWPNDVWLDGRKLAGILSETPSHRDNQTTVIVGIGLNRQADFSQTALHDRVISLHEVLSVVPDVMSLLAPLRSALLQLVAELKQLPSAAPLTTNWVRAVNQRDLLRDRTITVKIGVEEMMGIGLGLDWQGGYQLRLPDGTVRSLRAGQIIRWH
ncbi:biotin--[acetyl-CoA-carboxylase] ligase [filamentous cyanobacterium LEGE 11480]|uniref:Biotin--[acetyl-CoA-carboxylase] ligase n=1 Tax=Romeriopsis navalis LEGE 11480 TaxID=2777977 RepID=A0A928VRV3_9CYAN|nr:biotin--[acetyl-CoA-carboxylase] ligase [Romeriopsis navalis]MBE9031417.1 biotin--[acetyl-CoA-carboxylase] ligase [Romeriopsis navalis LEGE 11480]